MSRVVYDGTSMNYGWRVHVLPSRSSLLRRDGWRFIVERRHIGWDRWWTSGWFRSRADCERAAHGFLDSKEPLSEESVLRRAGTGDET